jgi:hypothetical protein
MKAKKNCGFPGHSVNNFDPDKSIIQKSKCMIRYNKKVLIILIQTEKLILGTIQKSNCMDQISHTQKKMRKWHSSSTCIQNKQGSCCGRWI